MKIKDLLESPSRNSLVDFVVQGFISFVEVIPIYEMSAMVESRHYIPKIRTKKIERSFTGKRMNEIYKIKVKVMRKEINEIKRKVKSFEKKMPILVMKKNMITDLQGLDNLAFVDTLSVFIKKVNVYRDKFQSMILFQIQNEILDETHLKYFNSLNEEIKTFNEFLDYLEVVFSKEIQKEDDEQMILFNPEESELYNLLIRTLKNKLELLDVPSKPILEELDLKNKIINAEEESLECRK